MIRAKALDQRSLGDAVDCIHEMVWLGTASKIGAPMRVTETDLPGVLIIAPTVHGDPRGFFVETWHRDRYAEHGIDLAFVQDNHSKSGKGILRGLHAQVGAHAQGKLIRVISGAIYDVAVDIRTGSPTFGRHAGIELTSDNHHQLWVPPGFAHGFCVLSDAAEVAYKCTAPYDPASELSIKWDDPSIGIPWPITDPILSEKDQGAMLLADSHERLPAFDA